jgi:serine/threonine-protein kinase RsbW
MSTKGWTWVLEKSVASVSENAQELVEELMAALDKHGWGGRDRFHIHMAVEEAIVNAIEHGNKRVPEKRVSILFKVGDDQVFVRVADEGEGFDFTSLPDPTEDDHLELPRGRGVMLMRELMTEMHYNARGNSVEMLKQRSAEEPPSESDDD